MDLGQPQSLGGIRAAERLHGWKPLAASQSMPLLLPMPGQLQKAATVLSGARFRQPRDRRHLAPLQPEALPHAAHRAARAAEQPTARAERADEGSGCSQAVLQPRPSPVFLSPQRTTQVGQVGSAAALVCSAPGYYDASIVTKLKAPDRPSPAFLAPGRAASPRTHLEPPITSVRQSSVGGSADHGAPRLRNQRQLATQFRVPGAPASLGQQLRSMAPVETYALAHKTLARRPRCPRRPHSFAHATCAMRVRQMRCLTRIGARA